MRGPQFSLGVTLVLFSSLISISSQSLDTPDACGKAAIAFNDAESSGFIINSTIAYDCLIDVPLQQEDALETVKQLRLFLQFYSSQTYYLDPPTPELELNPVDLNKTLDDIESNIKDEKYPNHYSFNRDLFNLFGAYQDGHVVYYPLCYVPFVFLHKYPLISLAKTPDSIPEIYAVDLIRGGGFSVGRKVVEINGQNVVDYLIQLANIHPELEWSDPDARFNQLLYHREGGEYLYGAFAARGSYVGDEDLILTWENGSTTKVEWFASLTSSVSADSFDSTDTFYSNVCLRTEDEMAAVLQDPSGKRRAKRSSIKEPSHPLLKRTNDTSTQYVNGTSNSTSNSPALALPGGELALYMFGDIGVIVVDAFDPANGTNDGFEVIFSLMVTEIISYLKKRKITKIIIDVSGNDGGTFTLGVNFASQLFPTSDIFFGTNMRWNPALAAMMTEGVDANGTYWGLEEFSKMDGSNFSSYQEFLGPVYRDNDYFTVIGTRDVAGLDADSEGIQSSYPGPQPFDTDNIILLSSGICASTCAVFAEALTEQGVHTVTFGGRPRKGPMQTVGGTNGNQVLDFDEIAYWAYYFLGNNASIYECDYIPKVQIAATFSSSINLRNSWRKDDQDIPIEFIYTPSEYKLFYTSEMTQNQSLVWAAARDVVWHGAKDLSGGNYSVVTHNSSSVSYNSSSVSHNSSSVAHNSSSVAHNSSSVAHNSSSVVHGSSLVDSVDDSDGSALDSSPSISNSGSGVSWSSLGELIWSKINGRQMNLDL